MVLVVAKGDGVKHVSKITNPFLYFKKKYSALPFPKGETMRYILGSYQFWLKIFD